MADIDPFFGHGHCYSPDECTDEPRAEMCPTCAFRQSPTVRPANMTVADVENETAGYDGFVCHHRNADGMFPDCFGWHLRFGRRAMEEENG